MSKAPSPRLAGARRLEISLEPDPHSKDPSFTPLSFLRSSEQQDQQQNDDDQGENASADVHVRSFPFR